MWRKNNNLDLAYPITVLLFLLSVWPAIARANDDLVTSPDQLQSGGLLFRMQQGYVVATKLNTDINIEANGLVARVSLKQTFRNDGQQWVEGVYVFPLPENAAVDRMRLHIGERFIEGEIREKEQAKKEYEAAKKAGKKASLVNQQRANLFTTAIANIAPGETVTVEIEYQQSLSYDEGMFSLRFPLTMTPRYIPGVPTSDRKGSGWAADTTEVPDASLITPPFVTRSDNHKVTLQASINAGMPLDVVASRYHPIKVEKQDEAYEVTFADGDVPMDHDLELIWRPVATSAPRALLFSEKHDSKTHLLLMLMPPDDATATALNVPRELILVIDTSGSMHGTSIEQARQAVLLALAGLRPSDKFNVIQFNSVTHALFSNSVAASASRVRQAESYVRSLQAEGGTEMRPALQKALRSDFDDSYLRQIIFVTDGSVGNEEALFQLIDAELGAARLFTVGIGSAPNGWFMSKAAEAGRGTYTFISALHEVNEKMARLFRKLEQPQVTNVAIQWPKGTVVDAYPAIVPDLYSGEPVVIKARLDRKPRSGDEVIVSGDATLRGWQATMSLDTENDSAGIAALWARARLAELENRRRRGEDADLVRTEIVTTAISHHLVSRYTSLIAVDKTPVRPQSEMLGKDQVPNLLPHGQSQQAILGFAATATSAPLSRMLGAIFLILAMFVWLGQIMRHDHAPQARA
jgi:Ca-activated chloride channel family protein